MIFRLNKTGTIFVISERKYDFVKKLLPLILLLFSFLALSAQTDGGAFTGLGVYPGNESTMNQMDLKVFPNPVLNKKFTVELNFNQIAEIRISNIAGIQVYDKKFISPLSSFEVIIENIPDGIYFLRVSATNNTSKTIKLLIRSSR
jgi:hypothetical protein